MAPKVKETTAEAKLRILEEMGLTVAGPEEIDQESGLTNADRARLAASGLLFDWADEAIAGVKALSPNVTYEDALADERAELKSARSKDGSLKYEIGGAVVPAVATTVASLVGAPFTAGGSLATSVPLWARLVGIGATQGLAIGTGGSEKQGLDRLTDAPTAVITGAIANPIFAGLSKLAQKAVAPVIDSVRRTLAGKSGKKVEDELLNLLSNSELSPEEFIARIRGGEILPEMSEDAAKFVAAFANKSGPGSSIIRDAIVGRKNKFINELYGSLQNDLAPDSQGGNIFKTFSDDAEKLLQAESKAYDAIWDSTAGQSFKEIDDVVLSLAVASRNSRNLINKKLDENGLKPIFEMVGKGRNAKLQLTRSLSLKEGELVKRAFMDAKTAAAKKPDKARTMKFYENQIKEVIDGLSPDLQATRQRWATINNAVKQYDLGKKVFGQNPEEFAVDFQKLVTAGDEDAIAALRAGAASSLKLKSQSSSATGTVTKLADGQMGINQKEREILEILYPGELIQDILVKVNRARGSIVAANRTFGGSQTAERTAAGDRIGLGQTVADVGRVVASGGSDILATAGIVTRMFGGKKPPFTDEQFKEIARLVISEDADLLEAAITDQTKIDAMLRAFKKAIDIVSGSQPRVTALTDTTEPIGNVVDPTISGALAGIVSAVSPETGRKIQAAAAQ
tara:strand:+ start:489 stop:2537 length:2049 start_codon:yes stop_codon:yes gene_type:complete